MFLYRAPILEAENVFSDFFKVQEKCLVIYGLKLKSL